MNWVELERGRLMRMQRVEPVDQVRSRQSRQDKTVEVVTGQLAYHVGANPATIPEQPCLVRTKDRNCGTMSGRRR